MPTTTRSQRRRQPARSAQQRRTGVQSSRHFAPPDYTRDYEDVRRDLSMIAIIGVLLFVGIIGLSFVI